MSSKQNLNAFFDKNKKKKPATKAAPEDQAQTTSAHTAEAQEPKPIKEQAKHKKVDYESSEEEKTDLVLDQNIAIQTKQEVEAAKRKEAKDQEDPAAGWRALEQRAAQENTFLAAQPKAAKPSGPQDIKFNKGGKPNFTNNKKKKVMDDDYPEMDGKPTVSDALEGGLSKKDNPNIGAFGSQPKSTEVVEERKEATKPFFTSSKKKALKGGDNVADIQNSKQNYDFSSLGLSAASSKTAKELREEANEGEPRARKEGTSDRPRVAAPSKAFDDGDFEVVKDKRRPAK